MGDKVQVKSYKIKKNKYNAYYYAHNLILTLFCFVSCHQIKLAFFVAIVGVVLTVLGVGTEFWVELAPPKNFYSNQVKYWNLQ